MPQEPKMTFALMMARSLDGTLAETGEVFQCHDALSFVDEMAVRQPFNRCQPGEPDVTIRIIASNLKQAVGATAITITGENTQARAESFMRELERIEIVKRVEESE